MKRHLLLFFLALVSWNQLGCQECSEIGCNPAVNVEVPLPQATTRLLVGANVVNATATYCDGTSASMSTGDVPVPYPHYCIVSSSDRSISCADGQP